MFIWPTDNINLKVPFTKKTIKDLEELGYLITI